MMKLPSGFNLTWMLLKVWAENWFVVRQEKKIINFAGKNIWCPEQKMEILMESEDHHIDPLRVESADLSENTSRGKHLWTNTEER